MFTVGFVGNQTGTRALMTCWVLNEPVTIQYRGKINRIVRSGIPFSGQEKDVDHRVCVIGDKESIDLHFFLDISTIEVFIDGGRHVMTGNVYPDLDADTGVQFFAEGGSAVFRSIVKYDILV